MGMTEDMAKMVVSPITKMISNSFTSFTKTVTELFSTQYTNIVTSLGSYSTVITNTFSSYLTTSITGLWTNIGNSFSTMSLNQLAMSGLFTSGLSSIPTTLTTSMSGLLGGLQTNLMGTIGSNQALNNLNFVNLNTMLGSWGGSLNLSLSNLWAGITQNFQDVNLGIGSIGDAFGEIGEGFNAGLNWVMGIWGEASNWVRGMLWEGFKQATQWLWKHFGGIGQEIYDDFIKPTLNSLGGMWKAVLDFFQILATNIYTGMENLFIGTERISPEDAPEKGMSALGYAVGMGLSAHLFTKVIELCHPLKNMGMGQISGFLADLGQFHRVGEATVGNLIRTAVAKPMQYYYQDKYRPYIPDDSMLQTLAYKEDIPMDKFYESMGHLGYDDYWIKAIETTMYREPRYFELIFMVEDNFTSPAWLENKIRRSGYCEADVPNVIVGLTKRTMKSDRNNYVKAAIEMYKEGYYDDNEFNRIIDRLDLDVGSGSYIQFDKSAGKFISFELEREHKYLIREAANMEHRLRTLNEYKYAFQEQYQKGLIDQEGLRLGLSTLGLTISRINSIVNLEVARKEPNLREKALEESELELKNYQYKLTNKYIILYKDNKINEQQLFSYLVQIGLSDLMSMVTVELEYAKKYKEDLPQDWFPM